MDLILLHNPRDFTCLDWRTAGSVRHSERNDLALYLREDNELPFVTKIYGIFSVKGYR